MSRKRLAEIVLRSSRTKELVAFYTDVIGLEIYAHLGGATFLKVDDDLEGHPQLLAIFDQAHTFSGPKKMQTDLADASAGSLHHFAFMLDKKNFESESKRLQDLSVDLRFAEHARFGWRSVYMYDPDGNSVELVCHDRSVVSAAKMPSEY